MTEKQAKRILKKLTDNDVDANIFEGYSGRGMFGAKTFGITLSRVMLRYDAERVCPSLEKMSSDSLGLGMIYY